MRKIYICQNSTVQLPQALKSRACLRDHLHNMPLSTHNTCIQYMQCIQRPDTHLLSASKLPLHWPMSLFRRSPHITRLPQRSLAAWTMCIYLCICAFVHMHVCLNTHDTTNGHTHIIYMSSHTQLSSQHWPMSLFCTTALRGSQLSSHRGSQSFGVSEETSSSA